MVPGKKRLHNLLSRNQQGQMWQYMPVIAATQKMEVEVLPSEASLWAKA
jgi:hypothetical protein